MGDFFSSVVDTLSLFVSFFLNSVKSVGMFYGYIQAMVHTIVSIFPALPTILGACFYAVLSFGVLKLIVGRMST